MDLGIFIRALRDETKIKCCEFANETSLDEMEDLKENTKQTS